MAGTTLRGIGEDESDEVTPPPEKEAASGPTVVDNAKVAESLRKLRSLEDRSSRNATPGSGVVATATVDNEATVPMALTDLPGVTQALNKPPGTLAGVGSPEPSAPTDSADSAPTSPTATSLPSGQTGITGTLMGQPSGTLLGLPTSAAFGEIGHAGPPTTTLIGQSLSTLMGHPPAPEGSTRPAPTTTPSAATEPPRPFRTLFGHSAPLPEEVARDVARANARRLTPLGPEGGGVPALDFSGKEQTFFESEPINDLYEPEFPRPKMFARVAFGVATASIVVVAVLAYFRFSGSDEGTVEEAATQAPAPQAPAAQSAPPAAPPATLPTPAAPSPSAAAPTPATPPPAAPTAAGPPASDDPALSPTPPSPVPAATTAGGPAVTAAESAGGPKAEALREPGEQPKPAVKPEPKAEPKPSMESRPSIAKSEIKKEVVKPEPTKSPVAKLTTKEPATAKVNVTPPKDQTARPPAPTPAKPVVAAPKLSGFQARTDTTKPPAAPKAPSKPVTSLSSPRDSASRPMKITAPAAPGARPAAASKPGGRPRVEDDPDATLPLSE